MAQYDRHSNIEDADFETAKKSEYGEGAPAEFEAQASGEQTDRTVGRKALRRFPRATAQTGIPTIAASLAESAAAEEEEEEESMSAETDEMSEEDVPSVSRKVRRRRRRTRPRSKTIAMKRLTREELRVGALLYPPVDIPRPQSRVECKSEIRPCPWVACKHHLYLDVNPETGSIKLNFPDLEPWELQDTCALDVAERGGITLEEVGEIMNLTRERIRQVEVRGLRKLRARSPSPEELGAIEPGDEE
ncbi:sigma factor-like helix-turn-helix DNA-binding protein [Haliangium ochraceum]|uniref:RNA polymerase sigma-70 domain-containing protein n=1 Tax=Haliangium ochraceum (strain DSM 14365 / JCM 11303 / SMP-2) TaxID=502025 RepID=D0LU40_HALO1|nr:sigma factor-like helix-turn-helix DNA-binding protein [Haliangium ochraceum]ACY17404.1 hypothetical protein Hoch_4915 [Haliangium ochraceum DSM 14365]